MLERDRVDLLVDPGTSFLELSLLAAHGLYGRDVHSASVVTGLGRISGRDVSSSPTTPPGAAFLPMQDEIFPDERQKGLTSQA
jgi:3-methylcrotonyl-CoA carboxylase beta subunit